MARLTTGIIADNIIKVESEGSIIPSERDLGLSPLDAPLPIKWEGAVLEVPVEVIKEVIVEVPAVCKCEPKQIEIIKEIPKVEIIEKIVEVPIKEIEYITVKEIEKVEIPVEVIVEKEVKVHDITQIIEEKKKLEASERKVARYQIAVAALIVISIILAVV